MSKKIFWFIGILALIIIGIIVLKDVKQKTADIDYEGQPYLGKESATVNIIEFGDYKCPHCKEFNDNIFPIINEQFVKTGKAKFYFMNATFISNESTKSAQFAETIYQELGNEKFWKFHHLLFENQTSKSGVENPFTDKFMEDILAKVASPKEIEQVKTSYDEGKGNKAVKKDMSTVNSLGVTSTPSIYVNGKLFDGGSMEDLIKMVDEASKDAE